MDVLTSTWPYWSLVSCRLVNLWLVILLIACRSWLLFICRPLADHLLAIFLTSRCVSDDLLVSHILAVSYMHVSASSCWLSGGPLSWLSYGSSCRSSCWPSSWPSWWLSGQKSCWMSCWHKCCNVSRLADYLVIHFVGNLILLASFRNDDRVRDPSHQDKIWRQFFFVAGPHEWQALPTDIRNIMDLSSFKRAIKTHFFCIGLLGLIQSYFSRMYYVRRFLTIFRWCEMRYINWFYLITYLLIGKLFGVFIMLANFLAELVNVSFDTLLAFCLSSCSLSAYLTVHLSVCLSAPTPNSGLTYKAVCSHTKQWLTHKAVCSHTKQCDQIQSSVLTYKAVCSHTNQCAQIQSSVLTNKAVLTHKAVCSHTKQHARSPSVRLPISLFIHLAVCLCVRQFVCLSHCPSNHLPVCPSVSLSAYLTVHSSVCLSVRQFVCLSHSPSICLSVCPSVSSSAYLTVHPSFCLSFHPYIVPCCIITIPFICLFIRWSFYPFAIPCV